MLQVKTTLGPSKINGVGLFAAERIPKGTTTWKYDPRFDISFDPKEVEKMPPLQKELISHFSYLSKTSGNYIYSIDDSRFTNHSKNANVDSIQVHPDDPEKSGVAARDIEVGEEITVNYRLFDVHDEKATDTYLNS